MLKRFGLGGLLFLALAAGCAGSGAAQGEAAPSDARIEVVLGLLRDQPGLERFAMDVNDPDSAEYGAFLAVEEIASRFGASDDVKATVREYFDGRAESVVFDAAGGFAVVELKIGEAANVFGTGWNVGTTSDGVAYVQPVELPTVPSELDGQVIEVLSTTHELDPDAVTQSTASTGGEDPSSCQRAGAAVVRSHRLYGISEMSAVGLDGSGVRVAVVSLGTFDPYAYSLWTSCLALESAVQPQELDVDVARGLPQEGELDVDIDTIVAVTPHLAALDLITVDEFGWVGRPFAAALNGVTADPPDVISSSIGFCEAELDAQSVELAEYALAALAATGTTVVATSGDFGSSACQSVDGASVQYPASSAFVTTVGGTQLAGDGSAQAAWFEAGRFASGGGTSPMVDRPGYQGDGAGRDLPDLALLAAPSDLPPIPTCSVDGCEWKNIGGTSVSGPLFAGGVVQIKQMMRQQGKIPVGMLNPLLYGLASQQGAFEDITSGSNDLDGVGCCTAGAGFDLTTGWGTPNLSELAQYAIDFAPEASSG